MNHATTTETLDVLTAHFGPVRVRRGEVLSFTAPLAPFADASRFVLLGHEAEAPFLWLQSLDQPALALVTAPYATVTGQSPPALPHAVEAELGLAPDEEPEVLAIIAVGETSAETTMNLLAPIYLCRQTNRARQVIVEGDLRLARVPVLGKCAASSPGREIHAGADETDR